QAAMARCAVLVIQRRPLGECVLGVDDEVLVRVALLEADAAAVVADDAAHRVDALLGRAVGWVEKVGDEAGELRRGGLGLAVEGEGVRVEAISRRCGTGCGST